jgi:c-di-AMP phosphodiesterase-like protein
MSLIAREISQEKEIKRIQIRKKEYKLSLFVDDILLYLKDYIITPLPEIQQDTKLT